MTLLANALHEHHHDRRTYSGRPSRISDQNDSSFLLNIITKLTAGLTNATRIKGHDLVKSKPYKWPYGGLEPPPLPRYLGGRKPPKNSAQLGRGLIGARWPVVHFGAQPVNPSCVYGALVRVPRGLA
jgi:hypothetical protein